MRTILTMLLVVTTGAAMAKPPAPKPPPQPAPVAKGEALPVPTGNPHSCTNYPLKARDLHETGTAVVLFHIEPNGTVKDVTVTRSSGFPELDDASVSCVEQWQYKPATKDGVAVEIGWDATVQWSLGDSYPPLADFYTAAWRCALTPTPDAIAMLRVKGPTKISVAFTGDTVSKVSVTLASGNDELDQRAATCFQSVSPAIVRRVAPAQSLEFPVFWKQP